MVAVKAPLSCFSLNGALDALPSRGVACRTRSLASARVVSFASSYRLMTLTAVIWRLVVLVRMYRYLVFSPCMVRTSASFWGIPLALLRAFSVCFCVSVSLYHTVARW